MHTFRDAVLHAAMMTRAPTTSPLHISYAKRQTERAMRLGKRNAAGPAESEACKNDSTHAQACAESCPPSVHTCYISLGEAQQRQTRLRGVSQ